MQWEEISKHWSQFERIISYEWKMLTRFDLKQIGGNKETLNDRLRQRYRHSERDADNAINKFLLSFRGVWEGKSDGKE